MKLKVLFHFAYRNASYNKKKTIFLLSGTIIMITIMTFLLSSSHILIRYYNERRLTIYGDYHLLIKQASRDQVMNAVGKDITNAGEIISYSEYEIRRDKGASLKGKFGAFDTYTQMMARIEFLQGRAPIENNEVALEQSIYMKLLQENNSIDTIEINITDENGEINSRKYEIVGYYRNISDVWPINSDQYKIPSIITIYNKESMGEKAVLVKLKEIVDIIKYEQTLSKLLGSTVIINPIMNATYENNSHLLISIKEMTIGIILLLVIAILICFVQSEKAILTARKRQYEVIRNIGGKPVDILKLSVIEAIYSTFLCVPIGLLIGYILSYLAILVGEHALKAAIPYFISYLTAIIVIITSILVSIISWTIVIIRRRKLQFVKIAEHSHNKRLFSRAVIGKTNGIHIAAIGAIMAIICYLLMPYLSRGFFLTADFGDLDRLSTQSGDFFIYRESSGYSTSLCIPDSETQDIGLEYNDIIKFKNIPEIKSVFYYYQMDRLKLIVNDTELFNKEAVKKSLVEEYVLNKEADTNVVEESKKMYGYDTNGKLDALAFCTLSGIDTNKLKSLNSSMINGVIDIKKLESAYGVIAVDNTDVKGDENIFKPGDIIKLSYLSNSSNDFSGRYDFNVEVLGTVLLTQDEIKEYFKSAYADLHKDGLGLRFIWGAPSFVKLKLPVKIEYLAASLNNPSDYDEVQNYIEKIELQVPGINTTSKPIASQLRKTITSIVDSLNIVISLSIFITGMLSWGFALYSNILQRGKEHGILKAIGTTNRILSSVYMEYGASISLIYSIVVVLFIVLFYFFVVYLNTGSSYEFLEYMNSSGLWLRSALCIVVNTMTAGFTGTLLFRHNKRNINEAIRYE